MFKLIRAPQKYVQGSNAFYEFYSYGKDYGNRFLFVSSPSGLKYCKERIEKSFEGSDAYRRYEEFAGISSNGEIERLSKYIKEDDIDVVVGLGGGSAIDTAKAVAYYSKKPVLVLPTVGATDAPCTGLSVIYNDDGTFDRYIFYPDNPNMVMVDTNVIAAAPVKYLKAGIGDALATYYEARLCKSVEAPSLENGGISDSALALCKLCRDTLFENGEIAIKSLEKKLVNHAVDKIIEAATFLSGVGVDNGGLAAAHSIYNGFTEIPSVDAMHGEIVAFGTIVQLLMEAAPKEELYKVIDFCYRIGLPITLADMNIKEEDLMIGCEKACAEGESIHNLPGEVSPESLRDFVLTADLLGQEYYQKHK